LLAHFIKTADNSLCVEKPAFKKGFPSPSHIDRLYRKIYLDVHSRYIKSQPQMEEMML